MKSTEYKGIREWSCSCGERLAVHNEKGLVIRSAGNQDFFVSHGICEVVCKACGSPNRFATEPMRQLLLDAVESGAGIAEIAKEIADTDAFLDARTRYSLSGQDFGKLQHTLDERQMEVFKLMYRQRGRLTGRAIAEAVDSVTPDEGEAIQEYIEEQLDALRVAN